MNLSYSELALSLVGDGLPKIATAFFSKYGNSQISFIVKTVFGSLPPKKLTTQSAMNARTSGGDGWYNFEPKYGLTFRYLDKIIPKLRAMYKEHPEWFEVPPPKATKDRNEVDYSII